LNLLRQLRLPLVTVAVLSAFVTVCALLPAGCTPLINHMAFHPETATMPQAPRSNVGIRAVIYGTADGQTVVGYFLPATSRPERLVVYFHGNAGHIGQRLPELRELATRTGAAVLGAGYRGYGASSGRPSEKGIYADGLATLRYARETLGFAPAATVLVGRSLGSTVATYLGAQGEDFAGLALITPLARGSDFGHQHLGPLGYLAGRSFDSLARAPLIQEPVLLIHGLDDTVIPFDQGTRLFQALPGPKRLRLIPGGRHNTLEFTDPAAYWGDLSAFVIDPPRAVSEA